MRYLVGLTLILSLLFTHVAQAEELQIGVFDMQIVINKSEAIKAAQKRMHDKYAGKKNELEKKRKAIEKLAADLTKSPDKKKQDELITQQKEYNDLANLYIANIQEADLEIRKKMDAMIIQAANQLAKSKKLNLVLNTNAAVYYESSMDVTNDMVDAVNKVWKDDKR